MEIKRENSFLKNVKCADVYTESSAEYVLPDYLGDVRKILFTGAEVRPSGRFAGDEEVEFSGIVVYTVVYLDSDNDISSVEFTSEYDYSVKCSGEKYKDSIADTRVSNYQIRLIGPRKMAAKSSLVGSARICESDSLALLGVGDAADAEVASKTLYIRTSSLSPTAEREYAEALDSLEGAIADEVRVIYSDAEISADSVDYIGGGVCIKGRLRMSAVIKNGEEAAYLCERTTSFDERLDFEGAEENMKFIPVITVSSVKPSVNAEESGCSVVLSCIVEYSAIGEKNQPLEVVVDGYLKNNECECTYEDFSYTSLFDVLTPRLSHSAELPRAEIESEGLNETLFLTASPRVESISAREGGVQICGEVRYSGVASEVADDGKASYIPLKFSAPFATNVNLGCQNAEKMSFDAKIVATDVSASVDEEKLYASSNLEIRVVAYEQLCERRLASLERLTGDEAEPKGSKITVYYPTSSDTLFSVAKKYRKSPTAIASANSLSESVFADGVQSTLAGVKKLIIF